MAGTPRPTSTGTAGTPRRVDGSRAGSRVRGHEDNGRCAATGVTRDACPRTRDRDSGRYPGVTRGACPSADARACGRRVSDTCRVCWVSWHARGVCPSRRSLSVIRCPLALSLCPVRQERFDGPTGRCRRRGFSLRPRDQVLPKPSPGRGARESGRDSDGRGRGGYSA